MPQTDPLEPFVDAWKAARGMGLDPSAAEIAPDRPELHDRLTERISQLRDSGDVFAAANTLVAPGVASDTPNDANPHAPPRIDQSAAWIPNQLGGYRVLGVLGRGGMGVVLRAEDTKLWRQVAIKLVLPEMLANKNARDRFQREARAQGNIEHDNVAQIYHTDTQDGMTYIVMPLLRGEALKSRLDREPVPAMAFTLKVAREVADGLAAAHAKGVIHRDIKPGNVWLEGDLASPDSGDHFRRCKVLDFGLARATGAFSSQVSASGELLGTPAYMSPEQVTQDDIDHRSDLFSLGTMLYEMATGKQPFEGSNAFVTLANLASHHPPPARTLNPGVPPGFSDLIGRMIAKSPDHRPATAREVSDAVRRLEAGFSEPFGVPPLPMPPPKLAERPLSGSNPVIVEGPPPDPFPDEDETDEDLNAVPPGLVPTPIHLAPPGQRTPKPASSPATAWKDDTAPTAGSPNWVLPVVAALAVVLLGGVGAFILMSQDGGREVATNPSQNDPGPTPTSSVPVTAPTGSAPAATAPTATRPSGRTVEPAGPPPEYTDRSGITLKLIPAGKFTMGLSDTDDENLRDRPAREVQISRPFYAGRLEITRGQFRKFVDAEGYLTDAEKTTEGGYGLTRGAKGWFGRDPKFNWRNVGFPQTDDHPVVNVSWNDAAAFCRWRSRTEGRTYRLPTEAEWEYLAQGGGDRPNLAPEASLRTRANVADEATLKQFEADNPGKTLKERFPGDDGYPFTAPAGSLAAGPFGLHDVIGNAAEWCQDYYGSWTDLPTTDPVQTTPSDEGRVVRGGSFFTGTPPPLQARLRFPGFRFMHELGFRVCVEAPE